MTNERKAKRNYKLMCRKYKRELKKIAKNAGPYDYGDILNFIQTKLKWMADYYSNGYNVYAYEASDYSREQLQHRNSLTPEEIETYEKELNSPTRLQRVEQLLEQFNKYEQSTWQPTEQQEFKKFWELVAENLPYLWD